MTFFEESGHALCENLRLKNSWLLFAESWIQTRVSTENNFYEANDITRFSNLRSASESITIKEDTAYSHAVDSQNKALQTLNTVQNTEYDNAIAAEKLKIDQAKLTLAQQKAGAKSLTEGTDKNGDGVPDGPDIKYTNVSGNVVTSTQKLIKLKDRAPAGIGYTISHIRWLLLKCDTEWKGRERRNRSMSHVSV